MTARTTRRVALALTALLTASLAACSSGAAAGTDDAATDATTPSADAPLAEAPELRLGYFANLTHANALVGVDDGTYQKALGDTKLTTQIFNAGPAAVEGLFGGAIDASFVGPNPAINAYAQSNGDAIRIVSGATSGGAQLVVRDGIDSADDLKGTTLATPQLGNTQDVALRAWLKDEGYKTDDTGGGDVSIQPQANGEALAAFIAGDIDGAWVPEPWATRFIQEGGAHVLVDEADLWPDGAYVTTHLIVRTAFLEEHPDVVKGIIEGLADAIDLIKSDPEKAKSLTNEGIKAVTDQALSPEVLDAAWKNLTFTLDPIASSLEQSAKDAEAVGLLKSVDLDGIYDLKLLNEVLADRGQDPVKGL